MSKILIGLAIAAALNADKIDRLTAENWTAGNMIAALCVLLGAAAGILLLGCML